MNNERIPIPSWMRIGFPTMPDQNTSGRDIGIVVLDRLRPHPLLKSLGNRLKYVMVNNDCSVTMWNAATESFPTESSTSGEHGLGAVLTLTHAPFEVAGRIYGGISPAANLIVLNCWQFKEGEGERLQKGIDWVLKRKDEWNIRIFLITGWNILDSDAWVENTSQKPAVQALAQALDAGMLVIASNGNTKLENELPPVEYFAVGSYIDDPFNFPSQASPHLDEPWGRNGDGHMRPDILAPRRYLAVPFYEQEPGSSIFSYFYNTSGGSTLVTGVCAYFLAKYPHLRPATLRQYLIDFSDPIEGNESQACRVNVQKVEEAIENGSPISSPSLQAPPIRVTNPEASLQSGDPVERSLALTILAKDSRCNRPELWEHTLDPAPMMRKVAYWALREPADYNERRKFWDRLDDEEDGGVRGWLAYGLLQQTEKAEVHKWIKMMEDINWSVRWCVSEYLKKYSEFPVLEKTHDPGEIHEKTLPVWQWYQGHFV